MPHDTHAVPSDAGTIAAVATPPGSGGVGIVRLSGPDSLPILTRLFRSASASFRGFKPYFLHHGTLLAEPGEAAGESGHGPGSGPDYGLDEVLAVYMPGPGSFTGEDVCEIHCHGGPAVVAAVLGAVLAQGARTAGPGEFTKRAFLNGRMDLTQAEAVAEMIAAPAEAGMRLAKAKLEGGLGRRIGELRAILEELRRQLCVAVDFPEEEVECLPPEAFARGVDEVRTAVDTLAAGYERCRAWREGALVVLAGRVNAGKSSLLNALTGLSRAIVTDVPGTTRDYIEERIDLAGLPVRLVDTAGLRRAAEDGGAVDAVEREGLRVGRDLAERADLVLVVCDAALDPDPEALELACNLGADKVLGVVNKIDLLAPDSASPVAEAFAGAGLREVAVSAKFGRGVDALADAIRERIIALSGGACEPGYGELVPNLRQRTALRAAREELDGLAEDIASGVPYDLLGVRLEAACRILAEITGEIAPDEVLRAIFDTFCIGK